MIVCICYLQQKQTFKKLNVLLNVMVTIKIWHLFTQILPTFCEYDFNYCNF